MPYSQWGQDESIVKFYKGKKNGFFVEIGAADGIELSNTYMLEKDYEWSGICVEAIPEQYTKLVSNRPRSSCCNMAVYNESNNTVTFDISNGYSLLSGINTHIDKHAEYVNSNKPTVSVQTISLNDLLAKYNAPSFIDYLSLDTEGSEYEILKTLNFENFKFGYIDVEHNHVEPRRTNIRQLLLNNGYAYIGENLGDDRYVHSSVVNLIF